MQSKGQELTSKGLQGGHLVLRAQAPQFWLIVLRQSRHFSRSQASSCAGLACADLLLRDSCGARMPKKLGRRWVKPVKRCSQLPGPRSHPLRLDFRGHRLGLGAWGRCEARSEAAQRLSRRAMDDGGHPARSGGEPLALNLVDSTAEVSPWLGPRRRRRSQGKSRAGR